MLLLEKVRVLYGVELASLAVALDDIGCVLGILEIVATHVGYDEMGVR